MPLPFIPFDAMWARLDFAPTATWVADVRASKHGPGERLGVGKWFDGRRQRQVEEIIWLSPDSTEPYARDSATLQGALTFYVRLMALERADPWDLDLGSDARENPDSAAVSVELLDGRGRVAAVDSNVELAWSQRARNPSDLFSVNSLTFEPALAMPAPRLPLGLGPNRVALFRVQVPIDEKVRNAVLVRVRAATGRRERIAVFRLWPRLPLQVRDPSAG